MKKWGTVFMAAAACMLLVSKPVFAAEQPFHTYGSAVITAGQGEIQKADGSIQAGPGAVADGAELHGPGGQTGPGTQEGVPSGELFPVDGGQPAPGGESVSEPETPGEPVLTPVEEQSSGRVIDPAKPMVALTFDDGPQPSVGNRIMDTLAQYGGKATFFMVGERVASHGEEVQRMVREGHEVANHSMNHKYFQKLGAADIKAQVEQANDAIEKACGVRPVLMRLPGGNYNSTVKANVNMPMIQWTIDTLDWKTKNADKTVQAVLSKVKDGDIVLMHELYRQSGDAAVRLIPELVNRGFQLVTVSEMAAAKGKTLELGKLYSSLP